MAWVWHIQINTTFSCVCPPVSNQIYTNFHCMKISMFENNMYENYPRHFSIRRPRVRTTAVPPVLTTSPVQIQVITPDPQFCLFFRIWFFTPNDSQNTSFKIFLMKRLWKLLSALRPVLKHCCLFWGIVACFITFRPTLSLFLASFLLLSYCTSLLAIFRVSKKHGRGNNF